MFSTWHNVAGVAGAGALSYLAAAPAKDGGKPSLRLSLTKDDALLTDVRLLGGLVTAGAAMYVDGADTKKTLAVVALASFASLFCTEAVRYRFSRPEMGLVREAKIMPSANFGALSDGQPAYGRQYQAQGAWASR